MPRTPGATGCGLTVSIDRHGLQSRHVTKRMGCQRTAFRRLALPTLEQASVAILREKIYCQYIYIYIIYILYILYIIYILYILYIYIIYIIYNIYIYVYIYICVYIEMSVCVWHWKAICHHRQSFIHVHENSFGFISLRHLRRRNNRCWCCNYGCLFNLVLVHLCLETRLRGSLGRCLVCVRLCHSRAMPRRVALVLKPICSRLCFCAPASVAISHHHDHHHDHHDHHDHHHDHHDHETAQMHGIQKS